MADKLMKYYQYAKETLGFDGQVKLAIETKLPSTKAAIEPDSPENIALFKKALEKLTGKPAPSY